MAISKHHAARAAAILVCLCAAPAAAHDFWIQPVTYFLDSPDTVPFTLQVGHGPFRQRSPISSNRITLFKAIAPNGAAIDLRSGLHLGGGTEDGKFHLAAPGAYVVVLETDSHAQSHLPALRFNDYLKAEGLTPAIEWRERMHRTDVDGSENYSRRAKVIVQVGPSAPGSRSQVTKPFGMPLEIVPETSPYAVPRPTTLPVRVLYEGRALAGALVKLTNLEHDATPLETHLTDNAGRAIFAMPKSGAWLLNVIWTKPLPSSSETDFETVFSSLSFGFPASPP